MVFFNIAAGDSWSPVKTNTLSEMESRTPGLIPLGQTRVSDDIASGWWETKPDQSLANLAAK
jgi:hypothetical protein